MAMGAKGQADADLASPPAHRVRKGAVPADASEQHSQTAEP